jgi:hypothetical protein
MMMMMMIMMMMMMMIMMMMMMMLHSHLGLPLPCDVITFFILVSSRCSLVWRGVIQCSEGDKVVMVLGTREGLVGDSSF